MQAKILNFIKYNNAFTIIFVVVFFSFGITFAANPDARDAIYASEETVISVDNTLIVSADLDNFDFNLRINSVTEDEINYYAAYSYNTLIIEEGVWQNRGIEKTLTVSKEALEGKDFGLYLAKELGENINYELSYLKRVKKLEIEKGESQKVVTIEYSGLVGKLLDPKEMVIEGYNPVIPEVVEEEIADVESNPEDVIVSTPYYEPENESEESSDEGEPQDETPAAEDTPLPAPEEMVDEELIQEVTEELLEESEPAEEVEQPETPSEETTPAPEPETPSQPAPEATEEPEAVAPESPEPQSSE